MRVSELQTGWVTLCQVKKIVYCLRDLSLKLNHFYKRCVSITVVKPLHFLGAKEGSLLSQLQHVTRKKAITKDYIVYLAIFNS